MISHIKGVLEEKFNNSIIVDVHGVGYEVNLSAPDFESLKLGDSVKLYTYQKVSESEIALYGFLSLAAKKLFELLISVNGVGPKAAMSILSLASPEEVRNAIANADSAFVAKAPGVGKKSAERVIVDLSDKVGLPTHYGTTLMRTPGSRPKNDEALDALIALGFPLKEATAALERVDPNLPVSQRVRLALRSK
ncbi:Holliday junction branch migration protein RuvA [Candidatus Saccharibacteria bacterium]|nr:Holliday junction branch migration protein RuvA [Candidatus Saccharibacteria bacterium]